jgi:hypothetical protein
MNLVSVLREGAAIARNKDETRIHSVTQDPGAMSSLVVESVSTVDPFESFSSEPGLFSGPLNREIPLAPIDPPS